MCFCGDNQELGPDWLFVPHTNRRTGEPCPPPGNYMETPEARAAYGSIEAAAAELIPRVGPRFTSSLPTDEDQLHDGTGWCAPSP